jgi:hypothetical protein
MAHEKEALVKPNLLTGKGVPFMNIGLGYTFTVWSVLI